RTGPRHRASSEFARRDAEMAGAIASFKTQLSVLSRAVSLRPDVSSPASSSSSVSSASAAAASTTTHQLPSAASTDTVAAGAVPSSSEKYSNEHRQEK